MGGHPHVVEPIELYKGKIIFYSMGNFIFDQSFSGPTSEGLSIDISVTSRSVSYSLFPLDIRQEQASLMNDTERTVFLNDIAEKSNVSPYLKSDIKNGIIVLDR